MFQQLRINYPENLPDILQVSTAQIAGVERVYFLLNLHKFGVNMIDLDDNELESDVE